MAILTAAQLRERVPRGAGALDESEFDDDWVNAAISEHDATFTRYCGDIPDSTTYTETIRPRASTGRLVLSWSNITAVSGITVDGTSLSSGYWAIEGGAVVGVNYRFVGGTTIVVSATHGFGSPEALKRACTLYVTRTAVADRNGSNRDVRAAGPDFTAYASSEWAMGRPTAWDDVNRLWNIYRPSVLTVGIA